MCGRDSFRSFLASLGDSRVRLFARGGILGALESLGGFFGVRGAGGTFDEDLDLAEDFGLVFFALQSKVLLIKSTKDFFDF